MNKTEMNNELKKAMSDFGAAYDMLASTIERYEQMTGTNVNYLPGFVESYPFDKSFDELAVGKWIADVANGMKETTFKVLNYRYMNTGGNCMVGIFEVWLPEEKRVVYALTNEEGCTLSTVDYISHELDIDDYEELHIDVCDWGRLTGHEKYFELYRHCLNVYTKDDCQFFGTTRGIQYHLLSDELQKLVDDDYKQWLEAEGWDLVDTDGEHIIMHPDYEDHVADVALQSIKDFVKYHDDLLATDESLAKACEGEYQLTFGDRSVRLPFHADTHTAIEQLLYNVIKEW